MLPPALNHPTSIPYLRRRRPLLRELPTGRRRGLRQVVLQQLVVVAEDDGVRVRRQRVEREGGVVPLRGAVPRGEGRDRDGRCGVFGLGR